MLELDNNLFIFDYFKDNCKKNKYKDCGQLKDTDIPKDKDVFIFVSHGHYDHYDKEIFTFNADNVRYVFYKEVKAKNELENIYKIIDPACEALEELLNEDVQNVMNKFNGKNFLDT